MLLDTGADVTLIPHAAIDAPGIDVMTNDRYQLMGYEGTISSAPVVRLELMFYWRTFRGEFLAIDQAWGILGRNILNAGPLLLDGPRLSWDEKVAPLLTTS